MSISLTIREFHQRFQKRLQLSFASGQVGLDRQITLTSDSSSLDIVDYLNITRPSYLIVIGKQELEFLNTHSNEEQQDIFLQLFNNPVSAIILSKNISLPDSIIKFCSNATIPIFSSELNDRSLIKNLRYYLNQALTETTTEHGVFIEVHSIGTLIMGKSGVGKSELALSLISRGHRLIADDIVEFSTIAPGVIDGMHPGLSNEFMEVRGLGIINIKAMFGSNALRRNKTLRMIVNMIPFTKENIHQFDRLGNAKQTHKIMDMEIPKMTLPVAPGRNLAVLVEAAARNHLLKLNGYNAAEDFIEKQRMAILANKKS